MCWRGPHGDKVNDRGIDSGRNRALSQPDTWRIGDVCDVENQVSARVMEKTGFLREGVLSRWSVHPNISDEPRDCVSFAKVKAGR
jgi:[ribosomal protein S5]-alanine N-acetyltransferase